MIKSYISIPAALRDYLSRAVNDPLLRSIFVPSFYVCLVLCGIILLASSYYLDGMISPAGVILLALSCVVFLPVYRNALKISGSPGESMVIANAVRALAVIILAAALSALLFVRMGDMLSDAGMRPGQGRWTARVESIKEKRYYHEAAIRFCGAEDNRDDCDSENTFYRGLARITGGDINQGDTIRFTGCPVNTRAPGAPASSANRSLLLRGIRHVFYLDGRSVRVVRSASSLRERAREALALNCDRLFNRETAAMIKALYFGNQDFITKTTMNDFKRAGVFHILSAGGLHVGVIAAIPFFLLGIVRVNRRIIMAASVIAVFLYLCMTDMPVCLLRSCVMFFMYAAQRIAGRETNIFNTFFLSCAAIVMIFPHEIFGLGFQLSYGATLGILLFHGPYRKSISWMPGFISNPIALTLSAQLLVLPVLLVRLNELNLVGLISNIIVVPLMSLLLVASLAAHALSAIATAGLWAGRGVNGIYWLSESIVGFMSGLDGHFYVAAAGPALVTAFCFLAAPLLPRLRSYRFIFLSIAGAVAIAWLSLGAGIQRESAILMRHGTGALLLVKKGTLLTIAGQAPGRCSADALMKIIAALSPRNVELHVTDPDYRNITGYTMLLKRLPVRRCYISDAFKIRGYSRRFLDVLERDGVSLVIHDCGPRAGVKKGSSGGASPEEICRLYRQVSAGEIPAPAGDAAKNDEFQYLTLH